MKSENLPAPAEEKLDFKKVLPIFVVVLVSMLGLTVIIPLMPLYAASFGASASAIGLLGAVYPAAQFFGAPFLGRLSDRFGRKPVLLVSQLGSLTGFLLLGAANGLTMLFIARLIEGLSGANISTAQAAISDSTTPKTRTQGLGLIGAAFGIGFVFGPVIAFISLALSRDNFHVPAFVAASFVLISILLTWLWLPETHPAEKRSQAAGQARSPFTFKALKAAFSRPLVGLLLASMFFQQLAFGSFQQILSLFTLNRLGLDASGNAIIFVFVGVLVVAVQGYFIGRWSRKYGEAWLLRAGLALLTLGLILVALTPQQAVPWYSQAAVEAKLSASHSLLGETPPTQNVQIPLPAEANRGVLGLGWLLLAMVPVAFGGGVQQPSVNSLLTRQVEAHEMGGTLGLSAAMLSAANAFAPLLGGILFQYLGAPAPYFTSALITAILWVLIQKPLKQAG